MRDKHVVCILFIVNKKSLFLIGKKCIILIEKLIIKFLEGHIFMIMQKRKNVIRRYSHQRAENRFFK
jgi:hypothetical protein